MSFSCTDALATLPLDYTFTAEDRGQHEFKSLVWSTAEPAHVLTAEDTASGRSASAQVTVSPGALAGFVFSNLPTRAQVGVPVSFTVYPIDARGNFITTYTRTVAFESTDAQASLPSAGGQPLGVSGTEARRQ